MSSKHICILNFINSSDFNKEQYKQWIDRKKITLDDICNYVLQKVWDNNKFSYWTMDFNLMRYYRQYTEECLRILFD